jgi:UDP-N-acetylmuramoylalanine--D-glutamate ligase
MDLVVGMGQTGLAVARFFKERQMAFATYDDRKSRDQVIAELGFEVQHFEAGEMPRWHAVAKMIVSPGVALTHPMVQAAQAGEIPVLSEIELAFRHTRGRVVAITGSNGKSTTTALIHHLLVQAGHDVSLCGNIGIPFIEQVSEDDGHIHVVEVSSFQLEHVRDFRPEIGVLINIVPDHLDRHGSFEAYRDAKLRLFQAQGPHDLALIGTGIDAEIPGHARHWQVPGEVIQDSDAGIVINEHWTLESEYLPPVGSHLRSNVMFACAVVAYLGLSHDAVAPALATFEGLEHRFEKVGLLQEVLWINDSKATNVHAAQAALRTVDRPYVLILGGSDKDESFTELDFSMRLPRDIVVYGETAQRIMADLASQPVHHVHDFDEACRFAQKLAKPGDALLLAPACASFDQHDNFAARGRRFKALFEALGAEQ